MQRLRFVPPLLTSNVTGRHRGPTESFGLAAERRHYNGGHRGRLLSSSSVASRAFYVLCMYSKFGHHPHLIGYLCAKLRFFRGLRCWASPWIAYILTHSLTDSSKLIWCPGNRSFCFGASTQTHIHSQKRHFDMQLKWKAQPAELKKTKLAIFYFLVHGAVR